MKHFIYIIFLSFLLFSSCVNNQSNNFSSMNLDQYEEYNKEMNEKEMIAITADFEPKLDITEEIKNTSLADLIRQEKGQLSSYDKAVEKERLAYRKKWRKKQKKLHGYSEHQLDLYESWADVEFYQMKNRTSPLDDLYQEEITYVSANSNLAKVYYLEDKGGFIKHNKYYYEKYKPNKDTVNVDNQKHKNWDKYL